MNDWFRSWHGAPTDNKWLVIARRAGVAPGVVSAVVWALLDYASQAAERGTIHGFDVETYAAFSGFEEAQIEAVIRALDDKGVIGPDGGFTNWQKRQPKREDGSSERAKAWREQKRNENERDRTQSNAEERPEKSREDTEQNPDTDVSGESTSASAVVVDLRPRAKPPDRKAHRLPADFTLTPERLAFAIREGHTHETASREFAKFTGSAEAHGRKYVSWDRAWENWVRTSIDGFGGSRGPATGGNRPQDGGMLGAYQRAAAHVRNAGRLPE